MGLAGCIVEVVFCLRPTSVGSCLPDRFRIFSEAENFCMPPCRTSCQTLSLQRSLADSSTDASRFHPYASNSRLLPIIPRLLYSDLNLDPEDINDILRKDITLDIYRQRRIRRALGLLPPSDILPLALSTPAASTASPSRRLGQYRGDVSVACWNAQAFFAVDPTRHAAKQRHLLSLLTRAEAVLISEAHGTYGGNRLWRPPLGCSAWWSPGATAGHAGVGIIVKDSLLKKFDANPVWSTIWLGRAAKLSLQGPEGALDLVVTDFQTGSEVMEHDLYGVALAAREWCDSFGALWTHLRNWLSNAIAPRS